MDDFTTLVLPYGIHGVSKVFQKPVAKIIEGIEGTKNFKDDIIIWPNTLEEHITRLRLVFDQLCRHGLKVNKNKCNHK